MTSTQAPREADPAANARASRALHMGVITWLSNLAGCLVGMVPLALPLSVLLVGATLITGALAMLYGVLGARDAASLGGQGRQDARLGFWLGASHMILSALVAGAAAWLAHSGVFSGVKL